jgi:hypothetical protein
MFWNMCKIAGMRITIPVVVEMTDEQVSEYATAYGLPRGGGRLYAKEVVEDVRENVLNGVRGLLGDVDVTIGRR